MKRQQRTVGAFVKVPLEDGYFTYARILKTKFAFYDFRTKTEIEDLKEIISKPILFITGVNDYAITKGLWLKVGKLPLDDSILNLPPQFIQDALNPEKFFIVENGVRRPASKEECSGLERIAVWTPEGIQKRLNDHYAGRKNKSMKTKPTGISIPTYNSILKDISLIYENAQSEGDGNWNKTALFAHWKIGERIIEVEQGKQERAAYGDRVLKQLSKDLNRKFGKGFSDRNLRYMRKFYQLYKLKKVKTQLSWSHYKELLLVDDSSVRLKLENRAIAENWTKREMLVRVKQALAGRNKKSESGNENQSIKDRLKRPLMRLYLYRTLQNFSSNLESRIPNLDLGFSIRLKVDNNYPLKFNALVDLSKLKVGSVIESRKKGSSYYFESVSSSKEMFTYKAYLERVIDGDTLLVNIDLGFSVFIKQRLRLRGLDAPELGTTKGANSKKFVESRLKNCNFLIIKTHGSDKYDRYLVDVIYLKAEDSEDKVLREGAFLNNELLDNCS